MPVYGPLSPSVGSNNVSIGSVAWVGPSGITDTGSAVLSHSIAALNSNYLLATGYDFSAIPDSDTIVGVEVKYSRKLWGAGTDAHENSVKLSLAGSISGGDRSTGVQWTLSPATDTRGGSTDLWELPLTVADVKDAGFGAAVSIGWSVSTNIQITTIDITIFTKENPSGYFGRVRRRGVPKTGKMSKVCPTPSSGSS